MSASGSPLPKRSPLSYPAFRLLWLSSIVTFVGSFVLVSGFFMGNRGPARLKGPVGDEGPWGISPRSAVW